MECPLHDGSAGSPPPLRRNDASPLHRRRWLWHPSAVDPRRRTWYRACLAALFAIGLAPAAAADAPLVAAASDLRFALDDVAGQFARATGTSVRIVYGSSGNFRRQIAE